MSSKSLQVRISNIPRPILVDFWPIMSDDFNPITTYFGGHFGPLLPTLP